MVSPSQTPMVADSGSLFKFTVNSAEEAASAIRSKLGEEAKVISVRQVRAAGFKGLIGGTRLEVVAQRSEPERSDEPASRGFISDEAVILPVTCDVEPTKPGQPSSLPELLRRGGFSERFLARLQTAPEWKSYLDRPLNQSLLGVASTLRRQNEGRMLAPLPARVAFLGSAGSGRTTALCKWLATDIFNRSRSAIVAKVEFDRPNPSATLEVFCEALGVPVVNSSGSLPAAPVGGSLYVDLPSLSLRNSVANRELAAFLSGESISGRVLVLNAAYDASALREGFVAGRDLGATHVVFTHLDEVGQCGKLWDFLFDADLQPLFLSTGPSLSGDCEQDVITALLGRTLPSA